MVVVMVGPTVVVVVVVAPSSPETWIEGKGSVLLLSLVLLFPRRGFCSGGAMVLGKCMRSKSMLFHRVF